MLGQLMAAARIYRHRWPTVCLALVISVVTHSMFALSLYLIARAMFDHVPTLREHLILVPLGMVLVHYRSHPLDLARSNSPSENSMMSFRLPPTSMWLVSSWHWSIGSSRSWWQ